ncbi:sensor domain-containing diguanylate cyclase [Uliginosibacterium gangwonense]|uniref:sensor domain-containing diguanylate cyclase n=1 Tax=Uliginosibacterium gangwonense TaxID=392736 RepID=UPI000373394C|nr:sensor domain-containing diguanylate cyclase [Uliginosibacterium gangwonense]
MRLRAQLSEPSGVLRAWLIRRSMYALLCGVLAGVVCWATAYFQLGLAWELSGALFVCLSVVVVIHAGFAMGKRTSTAIMTRFATQVEDCAQGWNALHIPRMGWAPYDRMAEAVEALAAYRLQGYEDTCAALQRYRQLADEAPGLEVFLDLNGMVQWMNAMGTHRLNAGGKAPQSIQGLLEDWVHPKDRATLLEHIDKAIQGVVRERIEVRLMQADNSFFWGQCRLMPRLDPAGQVAGVRLSVQDIQSRKDAETRLIEMVAALQRTQALKEHYLGRSNDERMRLSALLDIVRFGILFIDRDHRIMYINQAAALTLNLNNRKEVVGMRDDVLLELSKDLRVNDEAYREHLAAVMQQNHRSEPYDIQLFDGRVIREQSSPVAGSDDSHPIGRVWIFEDVTETLKNQRHLTEMAECDPLTGLLNRRRFRHELGRHIAESLRRGTSLALVSFDFDGFKNINDRFGHQAGDEVLIRVPQALQAVIRRNELFFRLGGDEFAILVPHAQRESVQRLAQRIIEKASQIEFVFAEMPVRITLSLGVAFVPDHSSDAEELVIAADRALYHAKANGKNCWHMAEERGWNPVDSSMELLLLDKYSGNRND